jgi:hypothetical protein
VSGVLAQWLLVALAAARMVRVFEPGFFSRFCQMCFHLFGQGSVVTTSHDSGAPFRMEKIRNEIASLAKARMISAMH